MSCTTNKISFTQKQRKQTTFFRREKVASFCVQRKLNVKRCKNQFGQGGPPLNWPIPRRKGVFLGFLPIGATIGVQSNF